MQSAASQSSAQRNLSHVPSRQLEAPVEVCDSARCCASFLDDADARGPAARTRSRSRSSVGRRVVDDQQLEVGVRLRERAVHRLRQIARHVVDGNADADGRGHRVDASLRASAVREDLAVPLEVVADLALQIETLPVRVLDGVAPSC